MTWPQAVQQWRDFQHQARERLRRVNGLLSMSEIVNRHRRITQLQEERSLNYAQAEQDFNATAETKPSIPEQQFASCETPQSQLQKEDQSRWENEGGTESPQSAMRCEIDGHAQFR